MKMFYVTYRRITTQSPFYRKCLQLRRKRIWEPLHLLTSENFETEEEQYISFVAVLNSRRVLGCVMLIPEPKKKCIRLCQLVVDERFCGLGIGSKLVQTATEYALAEKYKQMVLYAFPEIVPFFEKIGYHAHGDWYSHTNQVSSVLMTKKLSAK